MAILNKEAVIAKRIDNLEFLIESCEKNDKFVRRVREAGGIEAWLEANQARMQQYKLDILVWKLEELELIA